MPNFQGWLFMPKQEFNCCLIICMTVPLTEIYLINFVSHSKGDYLTLLKSK